MSEIENTLVNGEEAAAKVQESENVATAVEEVEQNSVAEATMDAQETETAEVEEDAAAPAEESGDDAKDGEFGFSCASSGGDVRQNKKPHQFITGKVSPGL